MINKNILIADDNEGIRDILGAYAQREGYTPVLAKDGEEALEKFQTYAPVILLLDVLMPRMDGFEVCREIRKSSDVPIIMITARGEDGDRILGLDTGADDYIVKPFSPGEVMARVRAVLRRMDIGDSQAQEVLKLSGLEINMSDYEVKMDGESMSLTKKEIEILWLMASNPGRVFSRENLLNSVWGYDYFGDARTVDTHIKRIRAKLNRQEEAGWDIKTVWGVGYKLEVKHA